MSAEVSACAEVHRLLRDHSCHLTMNRQFKSPANKNNQHPPHLWQLLTCKPTDCREHVTVTWLGKGISFHLSPTQAVTFFSQVLDATLTGFLLTSFNVTVFVVYTFRPLDQSFRDSFIKTSMAETGSRLRIQTWFSRMNVKITPEIHFTSSSMFSSKQCV